MKSVLMSPCNNWNLKSLALFYRSFYLLQSVTKNISNYFEVIKNKVNTL